MVKHVADHKCCFRGFCSEEEKAAFYKKVRGYVDDLHLEEDDPIDSNLSQVT